MFLEGKLYVYMVEYVAWVGYVSMMGYVAMDRNTALTLLKQGCQAQQMKCKIFHYMPTLENFSG